MRKNWLTWMCATWCAVAVAHAAPCVVTSNSGHAEVAGSLPSLLRAVEASGACAVPTNELRSAYGDALGMAATAHVIQWASSMQITLDVALPVLHARGHAPLIVRAPSGVLVRIRGNTPVRVGGGGLVIFEGLTLEQFAGPALEIDSDRNVIRRVRIVQSGRAGESPDGAALQVFGSHNHFDQLEVVRSAGVGVWVEDRMIRQDCTDPLGTRPASNNRFADSMIADNGDVGLWMHGYRAIIARTHIVRNGSDGIVLHNPAEEFRRCVPASMKDPAGHVHTVQIDDATFGGNAGDALVSQHHRLPAPVDLIAVSPLSADTMTIVGNVGRVEDALSIWQYVPMDLEQVEVELYLSDAADPQEGVVSLGRVKMMADSTRQFVARIPYPITIDGRSVTHPIITALTIDTEHHASSVFSTPLDIIGQSDWDNDGLSNVEEDANGNGLVDLAETDPRIPDSDGDLLNDGEEFRLGLNPRLADTDSDCLPDGLELGRTLTDIVPWTPAPGSVLQRPQLTLTASCRSRLAARKITELTHAVAWDPTVSANLDNLAALPDRDPTTTTDPLSADTDRDGIADGDEDWNWDGQRNHTAAAAGAAQTALLGSQGAPLETDPAIADSDGDGLLDGDEGDRNNNGTVDASETDPLLTDTDDDGLSDGDEVRRHGTEPNNCDTDGDGLGDGLELGVVHPLAANPLCVGLQTAGSNFASIGVLDPLRTDSDADGLPDGVEDAKHNGWLDAGETDPTTADTDRDGIDDYTESSGDLDADGVPDWLLSNINNGSSCAPPSAMNDLDCDGVPNARDDDSDNDGCLDRDEGIDPHGDRHGVPAAYQSSVKQCGKSTSGGGSSSSGGSLNLSADAVDDAPGVDPTREYFSQQIGGGGSCALVIPE